MERLVQIASVSNHWQASAAFLNDALKLPNTEDALILALHQQLAQIYEHILNEPSLAVPHLQEVAARQEWDEDEAARLRHQLSQLGEWSALAERLEIDITHMTDKSERTELMVQLGHVYFDELEQPQDAVDIWYRALRHRPEDKAILVRLMDGYRVTQQWTDSIKVLKKLTAIETDPERRSVFPCDWCDSARQAG